MKFAISSHKDYASFTEKVLVDSLLESGVSSEDIYFFIGGYEGEYQKLEGEYHRYSCPHNSIDFTGLISVIDLNIESDYWFLLHDTCYVGKKFYPYIQKYNLTNKKYVSLVQDLGMNMGAYRWDHIMENAEFITGYRNTSDDVQELKRRLIIDEDRFFSPKEHWYNNRARITSGPSDYYNTQTQRIVEHFPDIDLYKIKANWCLKDIYVNNP